jgi:Zn-dependent peptidase ImmA (M78 family)
VWCLGDDPIADLTATFEERGLLVITAPDPSGGRFDGLSAHIGALPVLVVGERWPGDRQRFTLAHELGHLILGDTLPEGLHVEQACNRFAGAFLAPQAAVRRALGARRHQLHPQELASLKAEFGLSMRAWIFRAANLHIIPEHTATRLHQQFTRNNWHRQEPGPPLPPETPTLHNRLVLRALAEDLIGESKAAELCGMSGDQLEAWLSMEAGGAPPRL